MTILSASFRPLKDTDNSSHTTLLGDDELEKDQIASECDESPPYKFPKSLNTTYKFLITIIFLLPWLLLPVLYQMGRQEGAKVLPKLPTHRITETAVKYQLKILDDEFYTSEQENLKYKGVPRKELDDAWNALIENMNMRVHPDEAKAAGFQSVEIADGSGDVYALPVVFHNLHCLYALRRAMFPNVYIDDEDVIPPGPNQINEHVDHCFDIIRQALMCQGDMSLYFFYWPKSKGRNKNAFPRHVGHKDHVCVDWENLQSVAHERHFSVLGGKTLLVNPFFPEASLNNKIVPARKDYSVYDGLDIKGPQLFEGLEDMNELKHIQTDASGM